ncbi:uncharacterized protein LOC123430679 [Hordeum vulgare subsp. vulgare]|uniref:DUF7610 domain-containing protein n=1 Tax=Hordeum vulgare subsp. vulgare TaxID=112509 RepID=A0A8I6WH96_HORVV|nr:uncharacterized protein LOC123430679 [Hordeum vulgare subsp. vulgare]
MENATAAPETEEAFPMETPLATTQSARWRPNPVLERKLCALEECFDEAVTSRPRRYGGRFPEVKARIDFLRTLIAAERDCHGGARRPGHLVQVEERFGVLERKFEQWAQSGVAAPTEEEEPHQAASESGSESSAGCSCNDSCSGFEFTGPEVASDPKCNPESGDAAEVPKEAAAATEVAPTTGTTARRRWWRRRAALCGAAGVVAVIALAAGLTLEFAAVAGPSANLVPT